MSDKQRDNDSSDNCIFCNIVSGKEKTNIVFENDKYIGFHDIKPDAEIHIQLIPKEHIDNVNSLTKNHLNLINDLEKYGNIILKEQTKDNTRKLYSSKLVFHQPPYNSVNHLHLHCMAGKIKLKTHFSHGTIFPWVISLASIKTRLEKL